MSIESVRAALRRGKVSSITWAPDAPAPAIAPDPVSEYLERSRLKGFSPHTLRSYRTDLDKASAFVNGALLEATRQQLEDFLQAEMGRGLKAATVGRRLQTLRCFFKDAVDRELVLRDPTRTLKAPRKPKVLPKYLREDDIARFLAALNFDTPMNIREAAIASTFYHTGMRLSELVGLDCETVRGDQVKVWGKGSKERQIPINDKLRVVLDQWLAVHPAGGKGPLFTSMGDDPGRLHGQQVRAIVRQVFKRAGLGDRGFTPHKLRHTFATRLINKGFRVDIIQQLLGHAGINTTMMYAHTELGDDVRQQLGEIL